MIFYTDLISGSLPKSLVNFIDRFFQICYIINWNIYQVTSFIVSFLILMPFPFSCLLALAKTLGSMASAIDSNRHPGLFKISEGSLRQLAASLLNKTLEEHCSSLPFIGLRKFPFIRVC